MCLQLLDGLLSLAVVEWLHMYPSAQVLGFSTDHLDKDDKEAGDLEWWRPHDSSQRWATQTTMSTKTSCSPRQNLRISFHLA